jgi:hypothetical protein
MCFRAPRKRCSRGVWGCLSLASESEGEREKMLVSSVQLSGMIMMRITVAGVGMKFGEKRRMRFLVAVRRNNTPPVQNLLGRCFDLSPLQRGISHPHDIA